MPRGQVHSIFLRFQSRLPASSVDSVIAIPEQGLSGDHHTKGGLRQVTLLSLPTWREVCQSLGISLNPKLRRANLVLDGITFDANSLGKILQIGAVQIRIRGETLPCRLMDEAHPGLKDARANWRGGVYGEILNNSEIRVGDSAFWCEGLQCPICATEYRYDADNYHWPTTGNLCVECDLPLPNWEESDGYRTPDCTS